MQNEKSVIEEMTSLCVFLCAYEQLVKYAREQNDEIESFLQGAAEKEAKATLAKKIAPLLKRSSILLRRYKGSIAAAIDGLSAVVESPGGGRLKAMQTMAKNKPISQAQFKSKFIIEALKLVSRRHKLREEVFGSGKTNLIVRRLGSLPKDPVDAIGELVSLPPVGGMRILKQWVKDTAVVMREGDIPEQIVLQPERPFRDQASPSRVATRFLGRR